MKRNKTKKIDSRKRKELRAQEVAEIKALEERIQAEAPPNGVNPLVDVDKDKTPDVYYPAAKNFSELPISAKTLQGLTANKFIELTPVQRATIPHALCGRDVLGAARTGSGKTLAFLVPMLEKLFREQWGPFDGLGALIITPTRELAYQIFNVLKKVGTAHGFSAGVVIGGKPASEEAELISKINILLATPGRLLYHLENTSDFIADNLKMLILDEADRILDMGFSKEVNAILEHLPKEGRQTLLFSATQTKSVKDLVRLSLDHPEYVGVDEKSVTATPESLIQRAIVVELNEKLSCLMSFVKSHLDKKCLVFLSTCKQVRFVFESFRKLQPGVPLRHLHGKMHQDRRIKIYEDFCSRSSVVLFATDIVARGLDFPDVDWIVQVDCPEDVSTYIHRVGRTARFKAGGQSLLMLTPSEQKFLKKLEVAKVPIQVVDVNPKRQVSIDSAVEALVAADTELKHLAQRAFISYMRNIFLSKDKEIFDVTALPSAAFAHSLGLPFAPTITFMKAAKNRKLVAGANRRLINLLENESSEEEGEEGAPKKEKKPKEVAPKKEEEPVKPKLEVPEEEEDEILVLKKEGALHSKLDGMDLFQNPSSSSGPPKPTCTASMAKKIHHALRIKFAGKKMTFGSDDEGEAAPEAEAEEEEPEPPKAKFQVAEKKRQEFIEKVKAELAQADTADKANQKERLTALKRKKKWAAKEERKAKEPQPVTLGSPMDDDDYEEYSGAEEECDDGGDSGSGEEEEEEAAEPAPKKARTLAQDEEMALKILKNRL